ncbi:MULTISPECIES: TRAP transporter large permease [Nitratireductor]|uniref:TRAP transporter large permease n=1 Tax=Nitratireductor TaxID=245876 RepID=UPI000D0D0615|nr:MULTISPECIES: TRAP transporter large permease subunit [Nitratireductor]PSM17458.1 C4-dicarboxylate ABC transporter permease [Nitratireductor sp. StC3]
MGDPLLAGLMFPTLFLLILLGLPVAFSLIVTAFGFALLAFGDIAPAQLYRFVDKVASQPTFAAIPLFVFMGAMLERSGIAARLFEAMRLWLGRLPGGLSLAALSMCAIFAAGTGIVGAVEVMVGMMAIPAMKKYNYSNDLIAGTICAGGSLGTMIPPSIVVVVYATQGQLSIGDLFAAVIIPSILMVACFLGYALARCALRPQDGPPVADEDFAMPMRDKIWITLTSLLPALALVLAVVGSIIAGIAAPTEAAGVGALGTIILTLFYRRLSIEVLWSATRATLVITAMVMLIVVGGTMFTSIFQINGGRQLIQSTILAMDLSSGELILIVLLIIMILGFVLDWISIVLICVPIYDPLLRAAGIDPVWFAVLAIIALQTSYLTPPMAPSLFYLRSIAPPDMSYRQMAFGVMPFVACQVLVMLIVYFFPATALWLTSFVGI